jgi:hypothetical protein
MDAFDTTGRTVNMNEAEWVRGLDKCLADLQD